MCQTSLSRTLQELPEAKKPFEWCFDDEPCYPELESMVRTANLVWIRLRSHGSYLLKLNAIACTWDVTKRLNEDGSWDELSSNPRRECSCRMALLRMMNIASLTVESLLI